MGDAYQCHLRVHLAVTKLFYLVLPVFMNGYLWDPMGVKLVNWFANIETLEGDSKNFQDLIRQVAANPKNREIRNFIKVQSSASMNYPFYENHREEDIPASLSHLAFRLARLRLALLAKLGWRGLDQLHAAASAIERLVQGTSPSAVLWDEIARQRACAHDLLAARRGRYKQEFHRQEFHSVGTLIQARKC